MPKKPSKTRAEKRRSAKTRGAVTITATPSCPKCKGVMVYLSSNAFQVTYKCTKCDTIVTRSRAL